MRLLSALLFLVLTFPATTLAAESYEGCKYEITTLPAVLTSQGVWCLKADLATAITNGPAITFDTNNITLDCNHFKIGGLAGGVGTAAKGVQIQDRSNSVLRNCNIRGFLHGVIIIDSNGTVIESNLFDGNTLVGIDASASNSGTIIRQNVVVDTGGTPSNPSTFGIAINGSVHAMDNIIASVSGDGVGNGYAFGIYAGVVSGTITGNRISGLVPDGIGIGRAIFVGGASRVAIDGNFVDGDGLPGSVGVYCTNTLGLARNNVLLGVSSGVQNCTSIGNYADPN